MTVMLYVGRKFSLEIARVGVEAAREKHCYSISLPSECGDDVKSASWWLMRSLLFNRVLCTSERVRDGETQQCSTFLCIIKQLDLQRV